MNLTKEQEELKIKNNYRLVGRNAVVFNPYYTTIPKDSNIYIVEYCQTTNRFNVYYDRNGGREWTNTSWILRDEFQLIDREFSDFKILKKGVRNMRKDKYGDSLVFELIEGGRDIQLSQALISVLNLTETKNCVGFASDPDLKQYYVFACLEGEGYPLNLKNGRISTKDDYNELSKMFNTTVFEVMIQPIIDPINNPEIIFYSVMPVKTQQVSKEVNGWMTQEVETLKRKLREPVFTGYVGEGTGNKKTKQLEKITKSLDSYIKWEVIPTFQDTEPNNQIEG